MSGIIGDLGYTSSACSNLMGLIREISETGNLETFVKFKEELDLAIDNRDCLSPLEKEAINDIMGKDNYFEDFRTGEYLNEMKSIADYADNILIEEKDFEEEIDFEKKLLEEIFFEGLHEMEDYIGDSLEREECIINERQKNYERI